MGLSENYIDAIIEICEQTNQDVTDIIPNLSKSILEKLQRNAQELNMLKTKVKGLEF